MSGVEIRIRSNSTQARQDLAKLEKSVGNIETTAQKVTKAFQNIAIGAISFYSINQFSKSLTNAADSVTNLENKVALVVGRGTELRTTMKQLSQVARDTRVPMSVTAETFNRFGLSLRGSEKSAQDFLKVTQTINKAVTISGASSESARAAIVQLGQGLASGQLRGAELNSVLEQTPRIAQAIADGMGIPFGKLRDAAQDGLLTTEAILNAVTTQAPKIDEEFKKIAKTVDSVSNALDYQFKRVLGEIARETGWSDFVVSSIEDMTDAFESFADNVRFYKLVAIDDFYSMALAIEDVAGSVKKVLSDIFSGNFDAQSFVDSITTEVKRAQSLINEKLSNVLEVDLKGPDDGSRGNRGSVIQKLMGGFNMNSFAAGAQRFSGMIINAFENIKTAAADLYTALFGQSSITGMFFSNHADGGFAFDSQVFKQTITDFINLFTFEKIKGYAETAKSNISAMLESIKTSFKSFYDAITTYDEFGDRQINFVKIWKDLKQNIDLARQSIIDFKGELASKDFSLSSWDTVSNKVSEISESFKSLRENSEAFKAISERTGNVWSGITDTNAFKGAQKAAEDLNQTLFGGNVGGVGPDYQYEPGLLEKGGEFLDKNKAALAGVAIASAVATVFPQETTAALKLAGIGLGLAAVQFMAGVFQKGIPITLAIAGFTFLNEERVRSIGLAIGEGIKAVGLDIGDAMFGGGDPVKQLGDTLEKGDVAATGVAKLKNLTIALGDAILDGIFGEENDFTGRMGDALAGALTAGIGLALIGFGPAKFALGLIGASIIGGIKNSDAWKGFKKGWSENLFGGSGGKNTTLEKLGKGAGKAFALGMTVAISDAFINFFLDFSLGTVLGRELTDLEAGVTDSLSTGFATGLTVYKTTKYLPAAVASGIGAALVDALLIPEVKDAFIKLGGYILDGFKAAILSVSDPIGNLLAKAFGFDYETGKRSDPLDIEEKISRLENQKLNIANRIINIQDELNAAENDLEGAFQPGTIEALKGALQQEHQNLLDVIFDIDLAYAQRVILESKLNKSTVNITAAFDKLYDGMSEREKAIRQSNSQLGKPIEQTSQVNNFATGGYISGPGGPRDDKIPAMLSNGEYVINAKSTAKYGRLISAINEDKVPKFANGGMATLPERDSDEYYDLVYGSPLGKNGFESVSSVKDRLSKFSEFLFKNSDYISDAEDILRTSRILALQINLAKNVLKNPYLYKPAPVLDYLLDFSKNNYLGDFANLDGENVETDRLKFHFPSIKEPIFEDPESEELNIDTKFANLQDIYNIGERIDSSSRLYDLVSSNGPDMLGLSFPDAYPILGGNYFDIIHPAFDKVSGYIMDIWDTNESFPEIEDNVSIRQRTFKDFSNNGVPYKSLDEALLNISGYGSKTLYDHAMSIVNSLSEVYRNFYGKNLKILKDKYPAGKNAHFWQGEKDFSPELGLMSFDTEDPYKYLLAYYAAIHEVGHGFDYLRDTSDLLNNDKWPETRNAYETILNETDANTFARNNVLPGLNPDVLDVLVNFSQSSYLSDYLSEAISKNQDLIADYPNILAVLYDKYKFDINNIDGLKKGFIINSVLSDFYRSNDLTTDYYTNPDNLPIKYADIVWQDIKQAVVDSLSETRIKEKFDINSNKIGKFATGGYITGEGGPTDDKIPAMLSNGEFVVRSSMAKKFRPVLEAINGGSYGKFAPGTASSSTSSSSATVKPTLQDTIVKELTESVASWEATLEKYQGYQASLIVRLTEMTASGFEPSTLFLSKLDSNAKVIDYATTELGIARDKLSKALGENTAAVNNNTGSKGTKDPKALTKEQTKFGIEAAGNFANSFREGLSEALKTGDFKEFGRTLLDSFTGSVIDSFTAGLTESLFKGAIGSEKGGAGWLSKLFGGQKKAGEDTGTDIKDSFKEGKDIKSDLSAFTEGFGEDFTKIFSGLGDTLSNMLSGLFGGGGFGSLFSAIGGFFGFSEGGIVPSTSYSKAGVDSVPAMLTPGELVVPASKVDKFTEGNNKTQQTVVNLSVTGDVSRQTRAEIVKMLPQIAGGVNAQNRENNYKYR